MASRFLPTIALAVSAQAAFALEAPSASRGRLDDLIAAHAKANQVPEALVHRVVKSESRYNPRAVGRGGVFGLMQLKHGTARALGYAGTPKGLLDPDTNLTYGVRYLAGAYRTARGDQNRAVSYFRRGYYYAAKRQGIRTGPVRQEAVAEPVEAAAAPPNPFSSLMSLFSSSGPSPATSFTGDGAQ
jgi:soluble lytic murein transglycosylase-like protein